MAESLSSSIVTLEQRLQDATASRDQTQVMIQKSQKQLDELSRKAIKRPEMDNVGNVEKQIQ
jgi:hypothetical protein